MSDAPQCERCGEASETVRLCPAMTAYHWDGKGDDPNQDVLLCDPCWQDHKAYWQERWDEYYSMIL